MSKSKALDTAQQDSTDTMAPAAPGTALAPWAGDPDAMAAPGTALALRAGTALLPGTQQQQEQLRAVMAGESFVALVAGPPGSGKRTVINRVAEESGLHAHDFEIDSMKDTGELRALIKRLSQT